MTETALASRELARRLGLLGVAASAVMVASDLILLYVPVSVAGYHFELLAPRLAPWRQVIGDYLGLLTIPLLVVALGHVYSALRPAGRIAAAGPVFLLGASYLLGAAFHHEVAAILQLARVPGSESAVQVVIDSSLRPLYKVFGAVAVGGAVWLVVVMLTGRTRYARPMVVASPLVTLPLLMLLTRVSPPALAGALIPASGNLSVWMFFVTSSLVLRGNGDQGQTAAIR